MTPPPITRESPADPRDYPRVVFLAPRPVARPITFRRPSWRVRLRWRLRHLDWWAVGRFVVWLTVLFAGFAVLSALMWLAGPVADWLARR